MVYRIIERWAAGVALLCLIGAGLCQVGRSRADGRAGSGLLLSEAARDIGRIEVGEKRAIMVDVVNPTGRPLRVTGVSRGCRRHACYDGSVVPVAVPPHRVGAVGIEVKGTSAGPFDDPVHLYTEANQEGLTVRIRGEVVDAPLVTPAVALGGRP